MVDFKGERYIAQSIIPGILSQPTAAPGKSTGTRLLYGTLEKDTNLTVKTSAFPLMENLGKRFFLTKRNVPLRPLEDSLAGKVAVSETKAADSTTEESKTPFQSFFDPKQVIIQIIYMTQHFYFLFFTVTWCSL